MLSDCIMLLDDALHRLKDIKTLQDAMQQPDWALQPPDVLQKRSGFSIEPISKFFFLFCRERYYQGQERSSRAFLALANAILEFLNNIVFEMKDSFVKSEGM